MKHFFYFTLLLATLSYAESEPIQDSKNEEGILNPKDSSPYLQIELKNEPIQDSKNEQEISNPKDPSPYMQIELKNEPIQDSKNEEEISNPKDSSPYMQIEFKTGYFRPNSGVLRDIYHSGGVIYALEYDVTVWKGLTVFSEGDYFTRHGNSIGESNKTKIQIGGFSFGLQYDFSLVSWLDFYIGLGPKLFFFRTTDHNPNVRTHTSKNNVGVIGKAGFYWLIPQNFFIDTFIEYSYCKMHFKGKKDKPIIPFSLDVGGLSAGGGIGYRF